MSYHSSPVSASIFAAFRGHESELHAVLNQCGISLPDELLAPDSHELSEPEISRLLAQAGMERLRQLLNEISELSSPAGTEVIVQICDARRLKVPGLDLSGPRLAVWLLLHHTRLFQHALDLLGPRPIPHPSGAIFSAANRKSSTFSADEIACRLESKLRERFQREGGWSGRLRVRSVEHGPASQFFEFGVFWEGPPQLCRHFSATGLETREIRPVREAWVRYDGGRGELEIEGGSAREREILWKGFMAAARIKMVSPALRLERLLTLNFQLQTRPGHFAQVTAARFSGQLRRRKVSFEVRANRNASVRELIGLGQTGEDSRAGKAAMPLAMEGGLSIESARIELVLDSSRAGRKVVELVSPNEIRFNRASHAGEVYRYLRHWRLLVW